MVNFISANMRESFVLKSTFIPKILGRLNCMSKTTAILLLLCYRKKISF